MSVQDSADFDLQSTEEDKKGCCCCYDATACYRSLQWIGKTLRKFLTFLISHLGLMLVVAGYCLIGAFTFERLEYENEQRVKKSIVGLRSNFTEDVWKITNELSYLRYENWSEKVQLRIKEFEHSILSSMKMDGWNGYEEPEKNEWTFAGALFYSIVVVTTIGYGDQTPKTDSGKLATVVYSIMGIPLMLFCLTNTGDAMASSFRFLYWKVCCFLCTTNKKEDLSNRKSGTRSRSGTRNFRRGTKTESFISSHLETPRLTRSYSIRSRNRPIPPKDEFFIGESSELIRPDQTLEDVKKRFTDMEDTSVPIQGQRGSKRSQKSTKSLTIHEIGKASSDSSVSIVSPTRTLSIPPVLSCSTPSTPLYFSRPPTFRDKKSSQEDYLSYDYDEDELLDYETKPVPLWVCMFLVLSYVVGGAVLFSGWEGWTILDSSYFCFITLTTIGFGDFVPKTSNKVNAEISILFCSIYLLFGMSLLVMTFNLVQDQVINKVRNMAYKLGCINEEEMY